MKVTADGHFAIIPEWVLYADISPAAVRVYCVLHRYANDNTGKCHPSRKSIGAKARIGLSTVDRSIDELVALGAVTVRHRTSESGDPTSNEYTVIMNRPLSTQNRPPIEFEQTGLFKSDNQTKASMNESQEPNTSSSADDGFNQFWENYPRKVGKGAARKAWKTALKKTDATTIQEAAALYRITCPKDTQYIAHPASWLNAERWADETEDTMNPEPTPEKHDPYFNWTPCGNCSGGWVYETDDQGYETARPCICRP